MSDLGTLAAFCFVNSLGQQRKVHIYKLSITSTVEERILEMQVCPKIGQCDVQMCSTYAESLSSHPEQEAWSCQSCAGG